jgi:hypothetical protein
MKIKYYVDISQYNITMATEEDSEHAAYTPHANHQFVGNQRTRRKDAKVVKDAQQSETHDVKPWNDIKNSASPIVVDVPLEVAVQRVEPYNDTWKRKSIALQHAYDAYLRTLFRGGSEGCQLLINLATELIDSTIATLIELEIHQSILVPGHMFRAYECRSLARANLRNFRGPIQDANDSLTLLYCPNMRFPGGSAGKQRLETDLLFRRGTSRLWLAKADDREDNLSGRDMVSELEKAVLDMRACCAMIRMVGDAFDKGSSTTIGAVTEELLHAMTLIKVKMGASRPHYSVIERTKVQKELGLGIYKHQLYRCLNCNETPSKTTKLQLCSRCKSAWLCSLECMKAAWKKGHKQVCKDTGLEAGERNPLLILCDSQKVAIDEDVAMNGLAIVTTKAIEECFDYRMLVRNVVTGRLFDSLSDDSVYFSPSEAVLAAEFYRQQRVRVDE